MPPIFPKGFLPPEISAAGFLPPKRDREVVVAEREVVGGRKVGVKEAVRGRRRERRRSFMGLCGSLLD